MTSTTRPPAQGDEFVKWLRENAPDCGDNSCLFGGHGKGGMRTNGGCRCFKDLPTMKRIYVERLYQALTRPAPELGNVITIPVGMASPEEIEAHKKVIAESKAALSRPRTEGWKRVPVEPTKEMLQAGSKTGGWYQSSMKALWKAMLSAAPAEGGERCPDCGSPDECKPGCPSRLP